MARDVLATLLRSKDAQGKEIDVIPTTTDTSVMVDNGRSTLDETIHDIYTAIENIERSPGPQGPQGERGEAGAPAACVSDHEPTDLDTVIWVNTSLADATIEELDARYVKQELYDQTIPELVGQVNTNKSHIFDIDAATGRNAESIDELQRQVQGLIDLGGGSLEVQKDGEVIDAKTRVINFTGGVEIEHPEEGVLNVNVIGGGGSGAIVPPTLTTTMTEEVVCAAGGYVDIPFYIQTPGAPSLPATVFLQRTLMGSANMQEYQLSVPAGPGLFERIGPLQKGEHRFTLWAQDGNGVAANEVHYFTVHAGAIELKRVTDSEIQFEYGHFEQYIEFDAIVDTSQLVSFEYKLTDVTGTSAIDYIIVDEKTVSPSSGRQRLDLRDFLAVGLAADGLELGAYTVEINARLKTIGIEAPPLCFDVYVVNGDNLNIRTTLAQNAKFTVDDYATFNVRFMIAHTNITFMLVTRLTRIYNGNAEVKTSEHEYNTVNGVVTLGNMDEGEYELEMYAYVKQDQSFISPTITRNFVVGRSEFEIIDPITHGLACWFDANKMSNGSASRNTWTDSSASELKPAVTATLHGYNFVTNGWMRDEALKQSFLRSDGEAYVEINYQPFKPTKSTVEGYIGAELGAANGLTIDIQFRSRQSGDIDAGVASCKRGTSSLANGFYIDATKGNLASNRSQGNVLYYGEDKQTRFTFVVDRERQLEILYIDGVINRARAISAVENQQEDYATDEKIYLNARQIITESGAIELGHFGSSDIFNFRVYERPLTSREVLQNHIHDIGDETLRIEKWIFNETGKLPRITFVGRTSLEAEMDGLSKEVEKELRVRYEPLGVGPGEPFEFNNCVVDWQGTSSLVYPVKNYKVKFRERENVLDMDGKPTGETTLEDRWWSPYPELEHGDEPYEPWPYETRCTLKANYMESSHVNNIGHAKMLHDLYRHLGHYTPAQMLSADESSESGYIVDRSIRSCVDGFPVALYYKENDQATESTFGGVYMFNIDKGADRTLGIRRKEYDENDNGVPEWMVKKYPKVENMTEDTSMAMSIDWNNVMSYEVSRNSADTKETAVNSTTGAAAFASYDMEAIRADFEIREAVNKEALEDPTASHFELQRLLQWVVESSDEEFGSEAIFNRYLNLDYCIDYYIHVMTFGMVDSFGKNMVLNTWDKQVWYPAFYDMDSCLGITNVGRMIVGVDVEPERNYIWQEQIGVDENGLPIYSDPETIVKRGSEMNGFTTPNSRLWVRLEMLYKDRIKERYQLLRQDFYSYENIRKYFMSEVMLKIPERLYNETQEYMYLQTHEVKDPTGGPSTSIWPVLEYSHCCNGNRIGHIEKWIQERLTFMDSMWDYSTYLGGYVQFRTAVGNPTKGDGWFRIGLKMYSPQYVVVRLGDPNIKLEDWKPNASEEKWLYQLKKVTPNEYTYFDIRVEASTDQEIFIHNAQNIMDITNLKNCVVETALLQQAPRLTHLDLSGTETIFSVNVAECRFLRELNLRDCVNLGNKNPATGGNDEALDTLSLDRCVNLRTLDVQNTGIVGMTLPPTGTTLKELSLQGSNVKEVVIANSEFLKDLSFDNCNALQRVSLISCNALTDLSIVSTKIEQLTLTLCSKLNTLDISGNAMLSTLNLSGCENLSQLTMTGFMNPMMRELNLIHVSGLEYLDISNSFYLENVRFASNFTSLKTFIADRTGFRSFAYGLTGVASSELDFGTFDLEYLSLVGCENITKIKNLDLRVPDDQSCGPFESCKNLVSFESSTVSLANDASYAFAYCPNLATWPSLDFSRVSNATRAFESCHKLPSSKMSEVLRSCTSKLSNAYSMFYQSQGLTSLPTQADFANLTGVTTTTYMFDDCINLGKDNPNGFEDVAGGVFKGFASLTSAQYMFNNTHIQGKLPSTLLEGLKRIVTLQNAFSNTRLTQIVDEDFFQRCGNASGIDTITSIFSGCSDMAGAVPNDLLKGLTNLQHAGGVFNQCGSLTGGYPTDILYTSRQANPADRAEHGSRIRSADYFFNGCRKMSGYFDIGIVGFNSLLTVENFFGSCYGTGTDDNGVARVYGLLGPVEGQSLNDLFQKCQGIQNVTRFFYGCQRMVLSQFPTGMLHNLQQLTKAEGVFEECLYVGGQLDGGIFADCRSLQTIKSFFKNTAITGAIPSNLLHYNQDFAPSDWVPGVDGRYPSPLTDVSRLFERCDGISGTLPADLFKDTKNLLTLYRTFFRCENITGAIPQGFFDGLSKVTTISEAFRACRKLNNTEPVVPGETRYAWPVDLFDDMTNLSNASHLFGSWIAEGDTAPMALSGVFPPKAFAKNAKLTKADHLFHYTQNLSGRLTKDLFWRDPVTGQNPYLQDMRSAFRFAGSSQSNGKGIYVERDALHSKYYPNINNVFWMFSANGTSMTGYLPPFWETHTGVDGSAAIVNGTDCFAGTSVVAVGQTPGLQYKTGANAVPSYYI